MPRGSLGDPNNKCFRGYLAPTGTARRQDWKLQECPKCGAKKHEHCGRFVSESYTASSGTHVFKGEGRWVLLKQPHKERLEHGV